MDNDYGVDLADILTSIRTAEVVAVRFISVGQRLLLDFRTSELDGPMVKVVEPVKTIEERFRSLRLLRPRLQQPEKIVAIWWPRFIPSLKTTGVWDEVMRRLSEAGHAGSVRRAEATLAELMELERAQQRAAILGEGFKTLWSASPSRR